MYPSPSIAQHVVHHNRGPGYSVAGASGIVPAALGANSLVFALYCAQQALVAPAVASGQIRAYIERLRVAFTTITAFTTPVVAARGIGLYRAAAGAGHALPTVGTALPVVKKDSGNATASQLSAIIANTAALTAGSVVREATPIAWLDLVDVGGAGGRRELLLELAAPINHEIVLNPDELLVISNPVAMDAAGTWQLSINECQWIETTSGAVA